MQEHAIDLTALQTSTEKLEPWSPNIDVQAHGAVCLQAVQQSCRFKPIARVLESSTNAFDRDLETFLFREISASVSASYIAHNLASYGVYNNASRYPEAFRYIKVRRPRLSADMILRHMYWRLAEWPRWPTVWERRLLGEGGLERVAWGLHEGSRDEPECVKTGSEREWEIRGRNGGHIFRQSECYHGQRTKRTGCGFLDMWWWITRAYPNHTG